MTHILLSMGLYMRQNFYRLLHPHGTSLNYLDGFDEFADCPVHFFDGVPVSAMTRFAFVTWQSVQRRVDVGERQHQQKWR